ncbi:MAG TPA: superinfection immunity protein [Candidatus Acidoferrales bacterium]|nr:superinfection immunity protein [Candidatus Acidoferrales bacterium]
MWDSPIHLLIVLFVLLFLCVPYFVPTIIAFYRKKANRLAILAVNVLLGWTLIGWVIALVWALKVDVVDRPA